jgi:hypothetical protein
MILKKSALVLSLVVLMTMFTFVGCGENDGNTSTNDNGMITEENTDNIIDETEKGVDDLGNDVKNGAEGFVFACTKDIAENSLMGLDFNRLSLARKMRICMEKCRGVTGNIEFGNNGYESFSAVINNFLHFFGREITSVTAAFLQLSEA